MTSRHPEVPELLHEAHVTAERLPADAREAFLQLLESYIVLPDGDRDRAAAYVVLGEQEEYVAHAASVVGAAVERGRALRTGELQYAADGLFAPSEAVVVQVAMVVGLRAEAPWAVDGLALLADVVVAPDPTARTVPSQAMVYALTRAVLEAPTPDGLLALEEAARLARHAGVKKKVGRHAKDVRRRLAARPEVALLLPADGDLAPRQVTAWVRTLEAALVHGPSWPAHLWSATVHGRAETSARARDVVWTASGFGAFRGAPGSLVAVDDTPVALSDDVRVRLWHPVEAPAEERAAWREHLRRHRIVQPFPQVFREHYDPQAGLEVETERLAVDLELLLGVARSEGWAIQDEEWLVRGAAGVNAAIRVRSRLFPGAEGTVRVEEVAVDGIGSPVTRSELMRSVDLLLSVSGVGMDSVAETRPVARQSPHGVREIRRVVLESVLAELPAGGPAVRVGPRHVEVAGHRVHLTTGEVTRDGEAVRVRAVTDHGLWMPLEDRLLARIVGTVVALHRAG